MPVKKKSAAKKKVIKKKTAKKPLKKKAAVKAKKTVSRPEKTKRKVKGKVIGIVTHYFPKVRAAVVKLKAPLSVGDNIKIKGHTTDFTQGVESMQMDRAAINSAKKGQEIGLLVGSRVRQHDTVYKA